MILSLMVTKVTNFSLEQNVLIIATLVRFLALKVLKFDDLYNFSVGKLMYK